MRLTLVMSLALVLGLVLVDAPLFAHHGTGVAYEMDKEITLKGVVTEWIWANPHCGILFDVTDDKGERGALGRRTGQSARAFRSRLEQRHPEARGQDHRDRPPGPNRVRHACHSNISRWPMAGCSRKRASKGKWREADWHEPSQ